MAAGFRGQRLTGALIRTGPEVRLELLIAHGHLLLVEVRQCHGLLEGKQVLGAPGAVHRFGDLVLAVLAVRVAQLG
jgi:hypothetical protein